MKKYASVIVEVSASSLERPFTYGIPDHLIGMIEIGSVVRFPFGNANREISGYVIDFIEEINFDASKLKNISSVHKDLNVESNLIRLANWMRQRTLCTLQTALKTMLPTTEEMVRKTTRIFYRKAEREKILIEIKSLENKKTYEARRRALELFLDSDQYQEKDLNLKYGISKSVLKTLANHGFITEITDEIYRNPDVLKKTVETSPLTLNPAQKEAVTAVLQDCSEERNSVFLLHGVTGSGKTEVYMQIIDHVISSGKQAIVLIPEIALTAQTVSRFMGRFPGRVGVLHSKLSKGERYDQWRRAKDGQIDIMIGPRSAIFAPFLNLGIIIIDEEHETTYKSEMPPKYHAREVAIKRASMARCPVVLGSATPLIESYYKAMEGKYKLLRLTDKAIENANLVVSIVDMRKELSIGNKSILSEPLKTAIDEALIRKEQVILFLNRRGFSTFMSCRNCGYVVKCHSCDIPFTYHLDGDKLVCHYCNRSMPKLHKCPVCNSIYMKEFGIGTQKVENYLKTVFPSAKVLRMDLDSTSTKQGHDEILSQFEKHEADILIGTQMVAKGHHFENVTVVGVLAADMSLYSDDFRAGERTFQLTTQVTGRAGRGSKRGYGIIQTYTPEHYSLQFALGQDYEGFYLDEIAYRRIMQYPPFSHMVFLLISGKNEKEVIGTAHELRETIELYKMEDLTILGPSPASISKTKNNYRWRIILKSTDEKNLRLLAAQMNEQIYQTTKWNNIHIQIDINPMISY